MIVRPARAVILCAALLAATASPLIAKPATKAHAAAGQSAAAHYGAALADPARPAADRARDAARQPAQLLSFAQIDKGEKVGDYVMGGGLPHPHPGRRGRTHGPSLRLPACRIH